MKTPHGRAVRAGEARYRAVKVWADLGHLGGDVRGHRGACPAASRRPSNVSVAWALQPGLDGVGGRVAEVRDSIPVDDDPAER